LFLEQIETWNLFARRLTRCVFGAAVVLSTANPAVVSFFYKN